MIRKLVITWLSLVIVRLITGETLRTFRMMEKIWTKRTKIKSHLEFNITCDNCDLLPIFTNVRIHNPSARDDNHVKKFRKKLLSNEIDKLKKELLDVMKS